MIILGDLVEEIENPDNWALYKKFFNVHGDARLRWPVFEGGVGNHDLSLTQTFGSFQTIISGNSSAVTKAAWGRFITMRTTTVTRRDWGPLHFVQLNVFPGDEARPVYDRATHLGTTPSAASIF